jgi:hypothetical protein
MERQWMRVPGGEETRDENETDRRNLLRICLVWPRDLGRRPMFRRRPTHQRAVRDGGIGRPGGKGPRYDGSPIRTTHTGCIILLVLNN